MRTGAYAKLERAVQDTLGELGAQRRRSRVETCVRTQTLSDVVGKMLRRHAQRVLVVDDEGRVEGVITAADILRFFVERN